jgi:translation initiation factor IF-1
LAHLTGGAIWPGKAVNDMDSVNESKQFIVLEGEVLELLPGRQVRVRLENSQEVVGYMGGKMRKFRIKVLPGDRVKVEMSPYDLTKGRVVYRF